MDSAKISAALAVVEKRPVPNGYRKQVNEKTGEIEYYFMWWFNSGAETELVGVAVYPTHANVLIDSQRRLWVPLENIRIYINPTDGEDCEPIGTGGHHYVSFEDDLEGGPVNGLKEAFNAALSVPLPI